MYNFPSLIWLPCEDIHTWLISERPFKSPAYLLIWFSHLCLKKDLILGWDQISFLCSRCGQSSLEGFIDGLHSQDPCFL